jgi:indoleacetamide hydrolase
MKRHRPLMTTDKPQKSNSSARTSRRHLLKAAAWASPLAAAVGGIHLAQGTARGAVPSTDRDMIDLGAREAVGHIKSGNMTAEAYATRLIEQHDAHKDLNGIITIDEVRVLEESRTVDKARARGEQLGKLVGLPFAVKDQMDVAGYPTTAGNGALKSNVPKQTAEVAQKMIDEGGIVFAKTNCSDMAGSGGLYVQGATTNNPWFGSARNPYDSARTPGGSSGGNGTVIGARIVPAAIGEDSGGSVRFPAAASGHAGLRPSTYTPENIAAGTLRKRYSGHGMVPLSNVVDTWGPMARTVADVAFLDTVITGEPVPVIGLSGVRIGIPRSDYWELDVIDPNVQRVTEEAFAKFKDAGAELIEIDLKAILALNQGGRMGVRLPIMSFEDWLEQNVPGVTMKDVLARQGAFLCEPSPALQPSDEERVRILNESARYYAEVFASNGLVAIAFPTVPFPAPLINVNGDTPGQRILINGKYVDELDAIITNLFSGPRLGAPGLSFPSGMADGLPVSMEFDGLAGDDSRILGLGIAAEKVLGPIPPPAL